MKLVNVTKLVLCTVALFFATSYTRPAHALPDHEYDTYYYTGCGENVTMVGYTIDPCPGGHYTSGTLDGDWVEETSWACDPEVIDSSYHVYEKCGGVWYERSTLGDCQCSH